MGFGSFVSKAASSVKSVYRPAASGISSTWRSAYQKSGAKGYYDKWGVYIAPYAKATQAAVGDKKARAEVIEKYGPVLQTWLGTSAPMLAPVVGAGLGVLTPRPAAPRGDNLASALPYVYDQTESGPAAPSVGGGGNGPLLLILATAAAIGVALYLKHKG